MARPKITRDGLVFSDGTRQTKGAVELIRQMVGTEDKQFFSVPPSGSYKITNLYIDTNGKVVVQYDNTPAP